MWSKPIHFSIFCTIWVSALRWHLWGRPRHPIPEVAWGRRCRGSELTGWRTGGEATWESLFRVSKARGSCKKDCCTRWAGMVLNASGFPVLRWALMPYLLLCSLATYESRGTGKEWVIVLYHHPPYFLLQRRYYSWWYFPSFEKLYLTTKYPKACLSIYLSILLKYLKWQKKKKNPIFAVWGS